MLVKDLKKGDTFIDPTISYRYGNDDIPFKVDWIARVFHNSYLIDSGVRYIELDGERNVSRA